MPRTAPWHSFIQKVFHNNDECKIGNKVKIKDRHNGTGRKRLCEECKKHNAKEKNNF